MEHKATDVKHFHHRSGDIVSVEIQGDKIGFWWRLCVNGSFSDWTAHYAGVLTHKGYGVATAYYDPDITEFVPFKLDYAEAANAS